MALKEIFAEQTLDFTVDETSSTGVLQVEEQLFALTDGAIYNVIWDGVVYQVSAFSSGGINALGNFGAVSPDAYKDTGEPFVILSAPAALVGGAGFTQIYAFDAQTSHTIAIYEVPSKKVYILEEQTITISDNAAALNGVSLFTVGENYNVTLYDQEYGVVTYTSQAIELSEDMCTQLGITSGTFLGNQAMLVGADTGEPFGIVSHNNGTMIGFDSVEDGTTYNISIYQSEVILEVGKYSLIFDKQTLDGFSSGILQKESDELSFLTDGEKYIVYLDGILYNCTAQSYYGIPFLGNLSLAISDTTNTGEPFAMGYQAPTDYTSVGQSMYMLADADATSHEIAIYRFKVIEDTVVLEEQEISGFALDENFQAYTPGYVSPAQYKLVLGETYSVRWDDGDWKCTSFAYDYNGVEMIVFGNTKIVGLEDTGEPFAFSYSPTYDNTQIFTDSNSESHIVGISIYQEQDGIALRDPVGRVIAYGDYKKIKINKTSGKKVIYSEGESVDTLSVGLDFSSGDQTIDPVEGLFVKSTIVRKPDTLKPSNIIKDVTIAGITGTYELPRVEGVSF